MNQLHINLHSAYQIRVAATLPTDWGIYVSRIYVSNLRVQLTGKFCRDTYPE